MATLSRMTKKAASSIIPLANRRTHHRNCSSAIFSTPLKTIRSISTNNSTTSLSSQVSRATSIPTHHHISAPNNKGSNSEDTLLSVVESEINCYGDKFHEFVEAPREFPFKIVDNTGKEFIRLTREFQGEEIKVTVYGPYQPMDPRDSWWYQEEESEEDQSEEEEKSDPPEYVRMSISISKKSGLTLELNVTADAADGIEIYGKLRLKNPNASRHHPPTKNLISCKDLNEELQKAFHTYLEVRWFKPIIVKFLCDYMVQRKDTKHTKWLKYLKNFIAFSSNNSIRFGKALREFPFTIEEEDAGKRAITLTREYQGDAEIKVTVDRPEFRKCLHLKGIVSNKSGLTLEFYGRVDVADGIRITSIWIRRCRMLSAHIWKTEGLDPALPKPYMTAWLRDITTNTLCEETSCAAKMATNLSRVMKKVITLTNRTSLRNYTSAIFNTPLKTSISTNLFREVFCRTTILTHHRFSALAKERSNSDETILSAIEPVIDSFREVEAPRDFPFKIEDNARNDRTITITRDYQGEEIKAIVHWPSYKDSGSNIELDVNVSNKSGLTLKCNVVEDYSPEEYTIRYLAVKNPNASDDYTAYRKADLSDLDENLQKALRTYLEVRGIEPSINNFLHKYMLNRKDKKYTRWLKKLKDFIAS
ncbi:hypothetical protein MKX03_037816 [Papaver bracteatum]|nr:hypothetical protein MKX03_037816 [Papaver bracteatum]